MSFFDTVNPLMTINYLVKKKSKLLSSFILLMKRLNVLSNKSSVVKKNKELLISSEYSIFKTLNESLILPLKKNCV